ncbi:MAG TPA: thioredoxin-dependent thiol peroxidase [Acidobacteriaceae bacterium]|jgi:peroxiredoxin Q/BCP|nr:thioredoxin-dependent thiol peroxidase [Acidobacteriaceae bacterium]
MPLPQPGDLVEDFTLPDQDGHPVTLSQFAGSPVVLFFYPRADTPGCTIEACGFRDGFAKLKKAGVIVLGISRDTVRAQKKFAEKYNLNYPLLADADMLLIKRFDLLREKKMYGKPVTGVARTTLLIGPDRKLLHVFENVRPEGHADEVLARVHKQG